LKAFIYDIILEITIKTISMKNLLSIFLLVSIIFTLIPQKLFANNNKGYFVVTAYYSPLPNQKNYLKGNYKDEIRLNGR
jgi:hypothetical protein